MKKLSSLFAPGYIGKLWIKNRIVMAPMAVNFAGLDGVVTDELIKYYEARARGGVGLIIVEAAGVDNPTGKEGFGQINIDHPRYIAGLNRLSQAIKAYGCRAFIQLFHAGRQTSTLITEGIQPVAPSPIPCSQMKEMPRELDVSEIKELVSKFADAADYACMAGFDGVEIHAAHGYLINQFLSPHTNQRRDEYGGSLENRMRFLLEIIRAIRKKPIDLAVSVRLNIADFIQGGLDIDEAREVCQHLEQAGADVINCSSGTYESGLNSIEPASYEEGWRIYLAEEIKKVVNIPVITGGVIRNPEFANQVVANQQADFVFLGRSLLADSEWANKAREGRFNDIRPCIMCNNCIAHNFKGLAVRCAVNPYTGRERHFNNLAAAGKNNRGRAAVAGSGPGGLQAAVSLRRRGFRVDLYEKSSELGGLMNLAGLPPHKHRILQLRDYMVRQLYESGAEVLLNREFTIREWQDNNYDCVVLATGSRPHLPAIKGYDPDWCLDLKDVLTGRADISGQQVVIVGGGSNGCEAADFLLQKGNKITIVEPNQFLAADMEKKNRRDLMNRLERGLVQKRTLSLVLELQPGQVVLFNSKKERETLPADYVIFTTGYAPLKELYNVLSDQVAHLFLIGDALQVRGFKDAILEGEMVGYAVGHL